MKHNSNITMSLQKPEVQHQSQKHILFSLMTSGKFQSYNEGCGVSQGINR